MFSFYEAVAPAVQQTVQQTPGAVVPKVQQQQPAQVPAQPVTTAQQTVADAGQMSTAQPAQTEPIQPVEPAWKKYLKYAAIAGGAIGGGALLHDIYHNHGIGNWWDKRIGSHFPSGNMFGLFGESPDEETAENEETETKPAGSTRRAVQGNITQTQKTIAKSAPWIGPPPQEHVWGGSGRIGGPRDILSYNDHRPANQSHPNSLFGSATMVKQLDPNTGRQYYAHRGGYGFSYPLGSEWATNDPGNTQLGFRDLNRGIKVNPRIGSSGWIPGIH